MEIAANYGYFLEQKGKRIDYLVEGGIGQGQALPTDFKSSIGKVVDVDGLASEPGRYGIGPQHKLHAAVVHHKLMGDLGRLATSEYVKSPAIPS